MRPHSRRRFEEGYTLVALMASVTIMLILMAAAVPSWRYVMKNDAEEELIFRGEIADAIARYQARNGNALPPSLEVLVKGKFLRREYKDPMTKHGRWRFVRQGEGIGPIRAPAGSISAGGRTTTTTTTTTRPSAFSQSTGGRTLGGIQGVASTSTDEGLRVFNGRTKYNEWVFLPGQPRIVGRPPRIPGVRPAPGQPGQPGQPNAPGRPAGPAPLTGPGIRR